VRLLVRRIQEKFDVLIFVDIGFRGCIDEQQRALRVTQRVEVDDAGRRLFSKLAHRFILFRKRGPQCRHVIED